MQSHDVTEIFVVWLLDVLEGNSFAKTFTDKGVAAEAAGKIAEKYPDFDVHFLSYEATGHVHVNLAMENVNE